MNASWFGNTCMIALIFSFRMLGLFMLIPVFTLYAHQLSGATPKLIGIALGCYGLTQGLLQLPFGFLSDRYGRKPLIMIGLVLFALGSLWGALTHSIAGMMIARMLQGMGAIGSVLIALLADITPDQHRTKAMAVIGVSIGLSFSIAMILSPAITSYTHSLSGIFNLTMIFALLGMLMVQTLLPKPTQPPTPTLNITHFKEALKNPHLKRLNFGIFCQHFMLTATFFAIPTLLQHQRAFGHFQQSWHFYLPLMISAFLIMVPIMLFAERKKHVKLVFVAAVLVTSLSQFMLAWSHHMWLALCGCLFAYFVAFNLLEAQLPSFISKQANPHYKGTAMGIYSSCQFLGLFAGGMGAGLIYHAHSYTGVFLMNAIMGLLWLFVAAPMKPDHYFFKLTLPYDPKHHDAETLNAALSQLKGVVQATVSPRHEETCIQLHLHKATYEEGSAERLLERQRDLRHHSKC